MIVYRLCNGEYADDLSGTGAKLYGGRWNSIGLNALYTTQYISLAMLELLVHIKAYRRPADYYLLRINIPDSLTPVVLKKEKLKKNWKDDIPYTRFIGDEFVKNAESALLAVPSVIVDEEYNYILNPAHSDSSKVKIVSRSRFEFDKRLHIIDE